MSHAHDAIIDVHDAGDNHRFVACAECGATLEDVNLHEDVTEAEDAEDTAALEIALALEDSLHFDPIFHDEEGA